MGKIIIHRKNEGIYKMMKYHVYLNDKKIETLQADETSALQIEKGKHKLSIKGGLLIQSNELKFSLNSDETKEFVAEYFKKGFVKSFIQLSQI